MERILVTLVVEERTRRNDVPELEGLPVESTNKTGAVYAVGVVIVVRIEQRTG